MLLIAAIRRRGVETVVDRSCFFVFCDSALRARKGEQCGLSVLAISAEDSRNRRTCSQNIRCDSLLRGETRGLPVRVRLSLRLSLFVVGSARRLRLPTSASSSSSPSYQPSSAPCRCVCPLPPSSLKAPLTFGVLPPSSQSQSSIARSFPYPSITFSCKFGQML